MTVLDRIEKEKIVAIIRLQEVDAIEQVVESLQNGGIRILEVTMNTPGALDAIGNIKHRFPDMTVGAGTVLDGKMAEDAIQAGADFLLAPHLKKETIKAGNEAGIPVIPGVFTPTEAYEASEYGANLVKVFPANQVTPRYIKDLHGPLPFIQGMAVGGVSSANIKEYLENGWHSVGVGSSLVNPVWIEEKQFDKIEAAAKELITIRDEV